MKTLRASVFALGVCVLLTATGTAVDKEKEPSYDGVPLSKWLERLNDPDYKTRKAAENAVASLGRTTRAAADALVVALARGKDVDERSRAAVALGRLGSVTPRVVPALEIALQKEKEKEASVRLQASLALGRIAPEAPTVTKLLIAALEDDDLDVQRVTAWSLGEVLEANGAKDAAAVTALVGKTKTAAASKGPKAKQADVRQAAIRALSVLGSSEDLLPTSVAEVTKALTGVLTSSDEIASVRWAAAAALGAYGAKAAAPDQEAAIKALVAALEAENWTLRRAAATALGAIGPIALVKKLALDPLKNLHDDEHPEVRVAVYEAIKKIDPKTARTLPSP